MQPEELKLLTDIQNAGEHIIAFARELTAQQYETDILLRSLVERQCEIIGEALKRLERISPYLFGEIDNARRIIRAFNDFIFLFFNH